MSLISASSSSIFKYRDRFRLHNQFQNVLRLMVRCYSEILNSELYIESKIGMRKRENYYRNRLCRFLYKYSSEYSLTHLIFEKECEETDENDITVGLLDIKVLNIQEDIKKANPNLYFTFECKRLDTSSNDVHYIKTGMCEFITGKYSRNMEFAGMIGFIEKGDPDIMVKTINKWLKKQGHISTLQNLSKYDIDGFNYSYSSKHERQSNLSDISLYHLMFDYTTIFH